MILKPYMSHVYVFCLYVTGLVFTIRDEIKLFSLFFLSISYIRMIVLVTMYVLCES